jgi:hypothetical protein
MPGGAIWNDEIDLAEAKLWLNGTPVEKAGGGDVD